MSRVQRQIGAPSYRRAGSTDEAGEAGRKKITGEYRNRKICSDGRAGWNRITTLKKCVVIDHPLFRRPGNKTAAHPAWVIGTTSIRAMIARRTGYLMTSPRPVAKNEDWTTMIVIRKHSGREILTWRTFLLFMDSCGKCGNYDKRPILPLW